MRKPPSSKHRQPILSARGGQVAAIDNRRLAKVAKLSGAPDAKAAGVQLHVRLGDEVAAGQPLYTIHAETPGELAYALGFATSVEDIIAVREP